MTFNRFIFLILFLLLPKQIFANTPSPYLINTSTADIENTLFRISHRFNGRLTKTQLKVLEGWIMVLLLELVLIMALLMI